MVLLSLGSGLITALMAHAKPSCPAPDWVWIPDEAAVPDEAEESGAVLVSDKTKLSQ